LNATRLRLIGFDLQADAPVFGDTLKAVGVQADEIPRWTIVAGEPPDEAGDPCRTTILDATYLDNYVSEKVKGSETGQWAYRYVETFGTVIGSYALTRIAQSVAATRQITDSPAEAFRRRKVSHAAFVTGGLLSAGAFEWAIPQHDLLDAVGGLAVGFVSSGVAQYFVSPRRQVAKRTHELYQAAVLQDPQLLTRLGDAIRPIYSDDIAALRDRN
jgi:hypothetical protein